MEKVKVQKKPPATLDFNKMKNKSKPPIGREADKLHILSKMKPKARFRALVRLAIANVAWLTDIDETRLDDKAKFNLLMLKSKRKSKNKSLFTLEEKAILMKPASERTFQEKKGLIQIIRGLKCFRRYPDDVQKKLASAMYFLFYGPNRVVVRQNQEASSLYFILDGEVLVTQTYYDPVMHHDVTKDLGLMGPGSIFGEVSLLHNIPRTATITTYTDVELLCLWREDFETVLKATLQQKWDECKAAMEMFPYFKGWNEVAVRECCILSRMKSYPVGKTILGPKVGLNSFVYFVLEGECRIIEMLQVAVKRIKGLTFYRRYKEGTELKPKEKIECYFCQASILRKGSCFCLGEYLEGRSIVAITPVTCLMCPQYWIMENNKADIWTRIRRFLDWNIPSPDKIYDDFIENRKWLRYKKQLIEGALAKKPITNYTTIYDVPYSIRLKANTVHDRPGYKLKKTLQTQIEGDTKSTMPSKQPSF